MKRQQIIPQSAVVDGRTYQLDADGALYMLQRGTRRRVRDPQVLAAVLKQLHRHEVEREARAIVARQRAAEAAARWKAITPESEVAP